MDDLDAEAINKARFEYKKKNHLLDDEDTFTQFSYSCKKLGVEIKTTSVPEAKGRIERLNETFQSRLPIELRRADVKTIEQANLFLNSYIKKYNERFALHLNITKSVYEIPHQLLQKQTLRYERLMTHLNRHQQKDI